jgi:hypothetical protein
MAAVALAALIALVIVFALWRARQARRYGRR